MKKEILFHNKPDFIKYICPKCGKYVETIRGVTVCCCRCGKQCIPEREKVEVVIAKQRFDINEL